MPRPNKKRIQLWIDWLLDPTHKQAQEALRRRGNRYCCLGGACEVYKAETGKGKWVNANRTDFLDAKDFIIGTDSGDGVLPETVVEWFGLPDNNPYLRTGVAPLQGPMRSNEAASSLNDEYNWTFTDIADAIKRTYLTPRKKKK